MEKVIKMSGTQGRTCSYFIKANPAPTSTKRPRDLYEAEEGMRVKEYGRSCCVLIDFDRKIVFDKSL